MTERPSGRAFDQLRAISLETGVSKYAEGSCLAKFGHTHVLCTASIDAGTPRWLKGQGLGYILMNKILDYARSRGIREVYGEVLRENTNMLNMCRALGFVRKENLDEPGVVEVRIELGGGLAV